jgi:hypothetical protein
MPSLLPALAKTWQISSNQIVAANASASVQTQTFLFAMKNLLKAFASVPWTVVGSSNGSAFNVSDTVDRWAAFTDVVVNSWIILRQTGPGFNLDLLIQPTNLVGGNATVVVSSGAGFTGGGATTRPTATDEVVLGSVGGNFSSSTAAVRQILNVEQSSDGACTRIWAYANNVVTTTLFIETLKNPITGLTKPWASLRLGAGSPPTYANITGSTVWQGYHSGAIAWTLTSEGVVAASNNLVGQTAAGQVVNEIGGGSSMAPCGLLCTTAAKRGRHGELFDFWLGSVLMVDGDTGPGASESPLHQFANLSGCVWLPYDQSVPLTA